MKKYNELNTEELFNLAVQHQKVNNLNQAKKIYKKILSFKPKFIEAHKNLGLIFQKSYQIIGNAKKDFKEIDYIETQTYRRNSQNLDCERHHDVFNQSNIIPKFCFSCFKIQIEPQNVKELIKLFFIFDNLKLPKNNWRKCMIEMRSGVSGSYKGFVYCSSMEEATKILNIIDSILKKYLKYNVSIKRGCTEFYKIFPNFKETEVKANSFMNYDER